MNVGMHGRRRDKLEEIRSREQRKWHENMSAHAAIASFQATSVLLWNVAVIANVGCGRA